METVRIFFRQNSIHETVGVKLTGQRQLQHDAMNVLAIIERMNGKKELACRNIFGKKLFLNAMPTLFAWRSLRFT
ncbi:MAG: hypothetical protein WDN67_03345 [Candidatus Moraniibacteriota bacterium]